MASEWILAQYRRLQRLQRGSRIDTQFVGQLPSGPLKSPQRVPLTTGPVQCSNKLRPQALSQRVLLDQSLKLTDQFAMAAQYQIRLYSILQSGQT